MGGETELRLRNAGHSSRRLLVVAFIVLAQIAGRDSRVEGGSWYTGDADPKRRVQQQAGGRAHSVFLIHEEGGGGKLRVRTPGTRPVDPATAVHEYP